MLRLEYENKKKLSDVKAAYKALITKDIDGGWDNLIKDYPVMKSVLSSGMKASDLLIAPFETLVDVYFKFEAIKGKLEEADIAKINTKAGKIFTYSSYKDKIAKFFMNPDYGFEIYNCFYCELENVRKYTDDKGVERHLFEIEHVLDKGTCPMVGLSLFNFVPSCGHCNSQGVKGNHTIGTTKKDVKKLSPTVPDYDFEHKVIFVLDAKGSIIKDLKMTDHLDDYDISFFYLDGLYKASVDLFQLHSRYNSEPYKSQLLALVQKRHNNPDNYIQELAKMSHCSYDEVLKEQFDLGISEKCHWTMNKARHDLIRNSLMPVVI